MIMNDERIRLGEWKFGDRLRTEKDPVKSQNRDKAYAERYPLGQTSRIIER